MTAIEHKELKGITLRNLFVTIISMASVVTTVMTSYFQLKNDIHDVKVIQSTESRINEIRLKVLETNVTVLQQEVEELKNKKQTKPTKNS